MSAPQIPSVAFLQGIGMPEMLIILAVLLLFFGARKLPELARGLGKSMKEFKKAATEIEDDFKEAMDATDPEKAPPAKPKDEGEGPPPAPEVTTPENEESRPDMGTASSNS